MRIVSRCLTLVLLLLSSCAWAAHMVRDDAGRSVAVPDHVHRVVSLSPSLTNTVYALGAESELVGITDYTLYPPEACAPEAQRGSRGQSFAGKDRCLASRPGAGAAGVQRCGNHRGAAAGRHPGVPVQHRQPVEHLPHHCQRWPDSGQGTAGDDAARRTSVRARARFAPSPRAGPKPTVLLVLSVDPLITAGRNAFITEMIEAAGARSR